MFTGTNTVTTQPVIVKIEEDHLIKHYKTLKNEADVYIKISMSFY